MWQLWCSPTEERWHQLLGTHRPGPDLAWVVCWCLKTNENFYQWNIFGLSNIYRGKAMESCRCSMEFESIIHIYGTSCRNMCDNKNKHSDWVSCNACSAFIWLQLQALAKYLWAAVIYMLELRMCVFNSAQFTLLVRISIVYWWKAETKNTHQDLWLGKLVPSSHQRSDSLYLQQMRSENRGGHSNPW